MVVTKYAFFFYFNIWRIYLNRLLFPNAHPLPKWAWVGVAGLTGVGEKVIEGVSGVQCIRITQERTRSTDIATELRRSDDLLSVDGATVEGLMRETSLTSLAPSPSKQDKKVTFAKLLEKMSKEMSSSSSDVSCAEDKSPSRIFTFGGARRSPRRSQRLRHTKR